jgi:ribulose 1,5-bisphosphate synthetase/thiazole synthase
MNKYFRAQEERNGIIKILENLSFDEKKEVLRIVDQDMINSTNKVLANDNPPGKLLTKLPTKFRSEVQARAVQMGRKLFIRVQVDELIKRRRKNNIKIIK